ncbi:MAG TPA: twin-arginine translocation signal domain-containing protein, partial [Terriglobia bacterium]|nr:twin-arginine translocation signal domain-containing protein [Terriglobia bacterium]
MKTQHDPNSNSRRASDRRDFLKASVAGAVGAVLSSGAARGASPATASRPNILYIHSHDTGRMTSPFGYAVPTPN